MFRNYKAFALLACLFVAFTAMDLSAKTAQLPKDKSNEEIQRTVTGAFDLQLNTVSRIWCYTTNYGILGHNVELNISGNRWPRGSYNQYIYAAGIWFGCITEVNGEDRANVEISYNPNNGASWMVPGRISDGDKILATPEAVQKYRTYFSTDYRGTGAPINSVTSTVNWPIWDTTPARTKIPKDTLRKNNYFGAYVDNIGNRINGIYAQPAFMSGEDIFCTYKDTDLDRYDDGIVFRRQRGYPLRLQYEQTIYSWGIGDYKDIMFVTYRIKNESIRRYRNCWISPVVDADIGHYYDTQYGHSNDYCTYLSSRPELNLGIQWSEAGSKSTYSEKGRGFGFLGMAMLETPAVDEKNDLKTDKPIYPVSEQLGMKSFRRWEIDEDKNTDDIRYAFMSENKKDETNSKKADIRFLASTGPFNMDPGQTTKVVIVFIYANNAKTGDITGKDTTERNELIRKTEFAYNVYYNNFEAPQPPDRANLKWKPLNNAVELTWDTTSEMSNDVYEKGLDFMGYKIFRSRDKDLDTFDLNQTEVGTDTKYPSGKGPFGWKQVAEWDVNSPFQKSIQYPAVGTMPAIDSLLLGGIAYVMKDGKFVDKDGKEIDDVDANRRMERYVIDTNSIAFVRVPAFSNCQMATAKVGATQRYVPFISYAYPYTGFGPWNKELASIIEKEGSSQYFDLDPIGEKFDNYMMKNVMYSTITFNVERNPLFWKYERVPIKKVADTLFIPKNNDTIHYYRETRDTVIISRDTVINNVNTTVYDTSYYVPRERKIDPRMAMTDKSHIDRVLQYIYNAIKTQAFKKINITDYERSADAVELLKKYFKEVTNNRTFIDIGDDNRSAMVTSNVDITKTERMINNIDYYYKLLSKDEGDAYQQSESKYNDAAEGLSNMVKAHPVAASVRSNFNIEVIYEDREKLGGLYDFNFFQLDQQRFTQVFKPGDTLELTFDPAWSRSSYQRTDNQTKKIYSTPYGLYHSKTKLYHITDTANYPLDSVQVVTGTDTTYTKFKRPVPTKLLYAGNTYYESELCNGILRGMFTDKGLTYIYSDTLVHDEVTGKDITMGLVYSNDTVFRRGKFSTGDFKLDGYCYHYHPSYLNEMITDPTSMVGAMNYEGFGTIGFEFDYGMEQWGGFYRADTMIASPEINIPYSHVKILSALRDGNPDQYLFEEYTGSTMYLDFDNNGDGYLKAGAFNNGPIDYTIKFTGSGTEKMTLGWNWKYKLGLQTFGVNVDVPYLEFEVYDNGDFKFRKPDSTWFNVKYPQMVEKMILPDTGVEYQAPRSEANGLTSTENLGRKRKYFPHPFNLGLRNNEFIHKCAMVSFAKVRNTKYSDSFIADTAIQRCVFPISPNRDKYPDKFVTMFAENNTDNYIAKMHGRKTPPVVSVGTQNRYYLSTNVNGENIDFQNLFYAAGGLFLFNFANYSFIDYDYSSLVGIIKMNKQFDYTNARDFKVGDTVRVRTAGGVRGLPLPGAKVRAVIRGSITDDSQISDKMMDQINVVPNPYYLAHQAVRSPYDSKLYFTRLPKICTIEIYTVNGNKIYTLHHNDANTSEDHENQESLEIWDLLTSTNQRVQSQSFIALIKAENGSQTIKNFSIVVPGARVITE